MKLESIELINYNEKYKNILEQINKDNLHHYVKQIDERLLLNGENVDFKLDCGYLVKYQNTKILVMFIYLIYLIIECILSILFYFLKETKGMDIWY